MIAKKLACTTVMSSMLILQIASIGINPASAIINVIFSDNFNRNDPSPWFKVEGFGCFPCEPPPTIFRGTGSIAVENGELSVRTDSFFYDVHAVRTFNPVTDFEASVKARVENDSPQATNFAIEVGLFATLSEFDQPQFVNNRVLFGYDGFFNQLTVGSSAGELYRQGTNLIPKGTTVELKIQKSGNNWEFFLNNQLITSRQITFLQTINFMDVRNGVGVSAGGTHVHYDDARLTGTFPQNSIFSTFKSQVVTGNQWTHNNEIKTGDGLKAIGLTMNPADNFLISTPGVATVSSFAYLADSCSKIPSTNVLLRSGERELLCIDAAINTVTTAVGDIEFILDIVTFKPSEILAGRLESFACKQAGVLVAVFVQDHWENVPVSKIKLIGSGTNLACRLGFKIAHGLLPFTPIAVKIGALPPSPTPLPEFDTCTLAKQPEDPIAMNTVRSGTVAKTIHAEKQTFGCQLEQGNLPVTLDVTIIAEIYESMGTQSIASKQALVITCMKTSHTLLGCIAEVPLTDVAPVRNCTEEPIGHPQEMNTVNKGKIMKTVEAQKEVFRCDFGNADASDDKKVDLVVFTEVWEDLSRLPDNPVVKKAFESFRCVTSIDTAKVESCQFADAKM